jgi:hypothetical protein
MSIGPSEVASGLLWWAAFIAWIALVVYTIVHCVRHVDPRWLSVLVIAAIIVLPFAGVAVYWFVVLIVVLTKDRSAPPGVAPGWYGDPEGRFDLRYWDGARWTEYVTHHESASGN